MRLRHIVPYVLLAAVALSVRIPAVFERSAWYDEAITFLQVSGHAIPAWPDDPRRVSELAEQMSGVAGPTMIAEGLFTTDVHPPLYFWLIAAWRSAFGDSLVTARMFSAIVSTLAVLVLYRLCLVAGMRYPYVPAGLYALSAGGVYTASVARAYALATLMLYSVVLLLYRSALSLRDHPRLSCRAWIAATLCGLLTQTIYISVYSVAALCLWWTLVTWRHLGWKSLLIPALASFISAIGLPALIVQSGTRAAQAAGYPSLYIDLYLSASSTLANLVTTAAQPVVLTLLAYGVIALLALSAAFGLLWTAGRTRFGLMITSLAVAPNVGLLVTDFLTRKGLTVANNYHHFGTPALLICLCVGIGYRLSGVSVCSKGNAACVTLERHELSTALSLLLPAMLAALMVSSLAWGEDMLPDWPGDSARSIAKEVVTLADDRTLVVIGAGYGRGNPGAFLLELPGDLIALVLRRGSDLDEATATAREFGTVILLPASDLATQEVERAFVDKLERDCGYSMSLNTERILSLTLP